MHTFLKTSLAATLALAMPLASFGQSQRDSQSTPSRNQANPSQIGQSRAGQQQPGQPGQRPDSQFRQGQSQASQGGSAANEELINYLAAKLMLANQCQVELAQMAAQKADHSQVKQFAQTLQQEHQKLNDQLRQAMPGLQSIEPVSFSSTGSASAQSTANANRQSGQSNQQAAQDSQRSQTQSQANQQGQRPGNDGQSQVASSRRGRRDQGDEFLDGAAQTLIDITRRAAENNHQAVTELLKNKQGSEFDMAFVGGEISAHMWLLAELKAIQDLGPQEFTQVVQQAEQATQQHLQQAKQLAQTLSDDERARQASRNQPSSGDQPARN